MLRHVIFVALLVLVCGCASTTSKSDPLARVNPVAQDRDIWVQLLEQHTKIRRVVMFTPQGVEATTTSPDPGVASLIKQHARAMQERMHAGARVRVWDPVFVKLFEQHSEVSLNVTELEHGVTIVETTADSQVAALLWSHAAGVSDFVREGMAANARPTRELAWTSVPPTSYAVIGGEKHLFFLAQPSDVELAALKSRGMTGVVNFRTSAEQEKEKQQQAEQQQAGQQQAGFASSQSEASLAASAGLAYTHIPYRGTQGVEGINDNTFSAARAALREAKTGGAALAAHCRTGNRVGAVWIAYRTLDAGLTLEDAIAEAKLVGLRDEALEAAARDYVQRSR